MAIFSETNAILICCFADKYFFRKDGSLEFLTVTLLHFSFELFDCEILFNQFIVSLV